MGRFVMDGMKSISCDDQGANMNAVTPDSKPPANTELSLSRLAVGILPGVLAGLYLWSLWAFSKMDISGPSLSANPAQWDVVPYLAYIAGGLIVALIYDALIVNSTKGAYFRSANVFLVKPAPLPKPLMVLGFGGIFFPILALPLSHSFLGNRPNPLLSFVVAAVVSYVVYFAAEWLFSRNAKKYRSESKITLNNGSVIFGQRSVPRENISRLVIRNHVLDIELPPEQALIFMGSNNYANTMAAGTQALSSTTRNLINGWRSLAGQSSYRIDLETGGRAYVLAGGLDEISAYGLMSDLARELKMDITG